MQPRRDATTWPRGARPSSAPLSLCVVNTYFAPLPSYAPLYFDTCRWNPGVRFLFLSDQPRPDGLPDNVDWVPTTLDGLAARLHRALGVRVPLSASLKVCDARPAFGLALADLLEGYTHWAYSDIDVLWGRILPLLARHAPGADVLSFREGWLSGTFTVFRNTEANATLFLSAPDALDTLASAHHHDFDESCGRWDRPRRFAELQRRGLRTSFWDVLAEGEANGALRWVHPDLLSEPDPRTRTFDLVWDRGALTDAASGEERIGYHLLEAKNVRLFRVPSWQSLPPRVRITEAGIITATGSQVGLRFRQRALGSMRRALSLARHGRRLLAAPSRSVGGPRAASGQGPRREPDRREALTARAPARRHRSLDSTLA